MNYQTKQSIIDGIVNDIILIYSSHPSKCHNLEQALIDNVFMVTMKFDGVDLRGLVNQTHKLPFDVKLDVNLGYKNYLRHMGQCEQNPETHLYLDAADRLYRYLLVKSFGRKFHRRKDDQPLAYAFIDYEDSRTSEEEETSIPKHIFEKQGRHHVHGIIAVRPGEGQRCIRTLRRMRLGWLSLIHI